MSRIPTGSVLLIAILLTVSALAGIFGSGTAQSSGEKTVQWRRPEPISNFQLDVIVDGRRLTEYSARGKTYIQALEGAEYELRITNPLPQRIAVALSVDGLNTIDARHTSAWNASKWVIEPYETITVGGWQMSSERARRFYFTNERDSYATKLGQAANLGVITAVFFKERVPPPPYGEPRPITKDRDERRESSQAPSARAGNDAPGKSAGAVAAPNEDYAATGIGRSVRNDVRWVNLELDQYPSAQVTIRYEYYSALLRLGVIPEKYPDQDRLRRREQSKGFEDRRFSPEP